MLISEIVWTQDRIEHIGKHEISPKEFEEVCFGRSLVLRAKSKGQNPVYYVLGQTSSGEYILCIVISFPDGIGFPVTARLMTVKEKQKYKQWRYK